MRRDGDNEGDADLARCAAAARARYFSSIAMLMLMPVLICQRYADARYAALMAAMPCVRQRRNGSRAQKEQMRVR